MESFFAFCFQNKWHGTHFTKFLYISSQFGNCKRRTKAQPFLKKILRLEGGSFEISIPLNLLAVD